MCGRSNVLSAGVLKVCVSDSCVVCGRVGMGESSLGHLSIRKVWREMCDNGVFQTWRVGGGEGMFE